jgi:DNA (cytosine-5)-methyltransferase 1
MAEGGALTAAWRHPRAEVAPNGIVYVDLFAGCGGLSLGFAIEGYEPILAVEWDADAVETYRRNVDSRIHADDVKTVPTWPKATVLLGGPPCQGFSALGARNPYDRRNALWRRYLEAVEETGVDIFVMENVPQLLSSGQFASFRREARKLDFELKSEVLCAADFGVPQMRNRAIVVGSRLGVPVMPTPTHGPQGSGRLPYVTVRKAFSEPTKLSEPPNGRNWHVGRSGVKDFSITRYKAVPPNGGNRFAMQAALEAQGLTSLVPPCWQAKQTGTGDVFGRLWWDRPALTIRTEFFKPEKGRYLHPMAHRAITVREAARLQSFPDWFEFSEDQTMASVARQIGNAVPPVLARGIAKAVTEHLADHRRIPSRPGVVNEVRQLELVG